MPENRGLALASRRSIGAGQRVTRGSGLRKELGHDVCRAARFAAVLVLVLGIGTVDPSTRAYAEESTSDAFSTEEPAWSYREILDARQVESWLRYSSAEASDVNRDAEIQQMVLVRTLAREAERLGLDRRPEVRVALAQTVGRLSMQALRRHVSGTITISDAQVEAKALKIADTYALPRRLRLRNLFKRYPANASAEDRAVLRRQMEDLRRRVLGGDAFAGLAKAESDSHTRFQGGLIGNVQPGTLRPSIDRVAMQLKAGEVSPVLEEPEGLTLLFCERVIERRQYSDDEMRDNAERILRNQAWRRAWTAMEAHLTDRAAILWHWGALDQSQSIDGSSVLVELLGDRLTAAEVLALVSPQRSLGELASLDRQMIRQRVEAFGLQLMASREVVALGLDDEALVERRRWSRLKLLAAQAIAEHVGRRLDPVSDAEADALARAEPERFTRPEHVRLAVIALPFDSTDPRPAYALAEQLDKELDAGELSFEELAKRHSVDASAAKGGQLPGRPRVGLAGRLGIDAARVVRDMVEPGDRSGWVRDDDRSLLWWVELRGVEPARRMTLEEAREPARREIGRQRVGELEAAFITEWLSGLDLRPIQSVEGTGLKERD